MTRAIEAARNRAASPVRLQIERALDAQEVGRAIEAHLGDPIAEAVHRLLTCRRHRLHRQLAREHASPLGPRRQPQQVRRQPDRGAVAIDRVVPHGKTHGLL